jgi:arylsulfatase A-like enzyme
MTKFILYFLAALLFSPEAALPAAEPPAGKPNILFILADDLGWGDLGCYGHPFIKTPHLSRLAKQGTLFTQFYVNASVCSPSRAAFFTGQYPGRLGIHGHFSSPKGNTARGACALAGVALPAGLDGEDASDVLLGSPRPRRAPLFWEWRYRIMGRG